MPPLRILHLTFHSGCAAEVEATLGTRLGHTVVTVLLPTLPQYSASWYDVDAPRAAAIWDLVQPQAAQADVLLTSDTAPLARVFARSECGGRPVIVWVCNRVDYFDPARKGAALAAYYADAAAFSRQPHVRYVANTAFEVVHAQRTAAALGAPSILWADTIRPRGLPLAASAAAAAAADLTAQRRQVFIGRYHNDAIMVDLRARVAPLVAAANLTLCPRARHAGLHERAAFAAVIHIPYSVSTLALFEDVGHCVPVLIPSPRLLRAIMYKREPLAYKDNLWLQGIADADIETMEWYAPSTRHWFLQFDTFDELPRLLQAERLAAHRGMLAGAWAEHDRDVCARWGALTNGMH